MVMTLLTLSFSGRDSVDAKSSLSTIDMMKIVGGETCYRSKLIDCGISPNVFCPPQGCNYDFGTGNHICKTANIVENWDSVWLDKEVATSGGYDHYEEWEPLPCTVNRDCRTEPCVMLGSGIYVCQSGDVLDYQPLHTPITLDGDPCPIGS